MTDDQPLCELCGEPMPPGEETFNYHGYSGPCPKPPKPVEQATLTLNVKCAACGKVVVIMVPKDGTVVDLEDAMLRVHYPGKDCGALT